MKYLITLMFVFGCVYSQAQTFTYFKKVITSDTATGVFANVKSIDNHFYIIGTWGVSMEDKSVSFVKLDSVGNIIKSTIIDTTAELSTTFINQSSIITSDRNLIHSYSVLFEDKPMAKDIRMTKVNTVGEVLWQHTYGNEYNNTLRQLIGNEDSTSLIVGFSQNLINLEPAEFYVIKVDTNGEVIWENTFGWEAGNAIATSAVATPDGGYLVAGGFQSSYSTRWFLKLLIFVNKYTLNEAFLLVKHSN